MGTSGFVRGYSPLSDRVEGMSGSTDRQSTEMTPRRSGESGPGLGERVCSNGDRRSTAAELLRLSKTNIYIFVYIFRFKPVHHRIQPHRLPPVLSYFW